MSTSTILTGKITFVLEKINSADFSELGVSLSNLGLVFLAIIITVFVLTVTFLGRAAKLSKDAKSETEQKNKRDFDNEIIKLKKKLDSSPTDVHALKEQLNTLETKKNYADIQINKIEQNYNALRLKDAVLIPGALFLFVCVLETWVLYFVQGGILQLFILLCGGICTFHGIKKLIITLRSVQEVSLSSDSSQTEQLQEAFIEALKIIDSQKEPRPYLVFNEKSPLVLKNEKEASIGFCVNLKELGNQEAKNVDVWFLFSPEIEIKESGVFKQRADYSIPNANTIRYKFDTVRKHTRTSGTIKVFPKKTGTYKMRYKIDCDGHTESATSDREVGIVVQ